MNSQRASEDQGHGQQGAGSPDALIRRRGQVASAFGLGRSGHVCWGFEQQAGFHQAAVDFLADGVRSGQRLFYLSSEQREVQRAVLGPLGDIESMLDRGELSVAHVDEVYDPTRPIDPEMQLTGYAAQTDQALSHGYTGLRAAADATALVADPAKREAHVRWESVADRYMAANPLAALCGYDQNAIPDDLLGDLRCVHPASHDGDRQLPFRLAYVATDTLALEGEVDTFSAVNLERMLGIVLAEGDLAALDLKGLDFIDHRGLITLTNYTREHPVPLVNMPGTARRICELLKLIVRETQ